MKKDRDEAYWVKEIREALEWRRMFSNEDRWEIFKAYYSHRVEEPLSPHFNLIYMLANVLIPSLVFQTPGVINIPRGGASGAWGQFYDSVDKYLMETMEVTDVLERGIVNGFLTNSICVGFGFDLSPEQQELTTLTQEQEDAFPEIQSANRARKNNLPWLDLIPSHRCLVAKGTKTMRNCRWSAKLITTPVSILKEVKGLKKVAPCSVPLTLQQHESHLWNNSSGNHVAYWEIHDAETGKWLWLSADGKFILPPTEDPLQSFGLPLEVISMNMNPDSIWGTPDSAYIESAHVEGEETRQYGRLQRRLALLKVLYDSDAITQEELQLFMQGAPGIGLPIKRTAQSSLQDNIQFIQSHVQIEYFEAQKQILNDAQLISGHGPNQYGTFAPGRRTAYETQVVESSNNARLGRRRKKIGEAVERLMQRSNIMVSKYWSEPQVQQVVGVDGAMYWVEAKASDLSNYETHLQTKVNVESMVPTSREQKKREAFELLQLLTNFTEAGVNPLPIIQQLLSTFEWLDVKQVLPQMGTQYAIEDFAKQQEQQIQGGGLGEKLGKNLSGVPNLSGRYPAEVQTEEENNE
jgi:hypothetical protein